MATTKSKKYIINLGWGSAQKKMFSSKKKAEQYTLFNAEIEASCHPNTITFFSVYCVDDRKYIISGSILNKNGKLSRVTKRYK